MGREARCMAEFGGWMGEGKLLLETDELVFRGAARWSSPLKALAEVSAKDGWLEVQGAGSTARFDLGGLAEKWAHAIRNPRGLLDKLDVRPASRVAIVGVDDAEFIAKLRERAANVSEAAGPEAVEAGTDLVFYAAASPADLEALPLLRTRIAQNGGVWVISPKGRKEIADVVVIAAAKQAGLVDVKVARFSETLTALKLVIPRAERSVAADRR
jgi:hypothetical protein